MVGAALSRECIAHECAPTEISNNNDPGGENSTWHDSSYFKLIAWSDPSDSEKKIQESLLFSILIYIYNLFINIYTINLKLNIFFLVTR